MCFGQNFLVNVIKDFIDQGYNLNHVAEKTIKIIVKKMCRMISISDIKCMLLNGN